ncbi:MAG: MATE family efflux transporter [Spirochaetaceae bacterium]|jgi:putative MATE family efflux protein|nr:MATE family efflux transporter [Spirochaetaceae bacterium]
MAVQWNNRAIFRLLWPLIIEQVLALTMGAADTVMVSTVGEHAVSGVNIVDNINNLLIIAFTALGTGGAVVASQYIGRKDRRNSSLASKQLVYIITVISLVITLGVFPFRRGLIGLIYGRIEGDVMASAGLYLGITALSYPFLGIYNGCSALFRAAGNSRVPMLIALLVNVMNIGGNAFFIYVLHIGVAGAAISTLLSRVAAGAVVLFLLIPDRESPISLSGIWKISFARNMIHNILNVGIPNALENSMFQMGRLLTQRIFTVFGTAAMAGNAIASVINSFSFMPGNAFGMALLTVVGQCIGAGNYKEAERQTFKIMRAAWISIFTLSLGILVFLEPLVSLFNLSAQAHGMAKSYLRVHCVSMMLFWAFSFALPNALRAAGDNRFVMVVASLSMWTIRVSCAYILTFVFGMGPVGVWLGMGLDFVCRGGFYLHRWRHGRWKEKRVITG